MADKAIYNVGISAATVMTPTKAVLMQDTDGNTTPERVLFSLLGGLVWATAGTPDQNQTAVVGQVLGWNISTLTADRDFILPDTAKVGEKCGLYITTGDDTYTANIKTQGDGSLINNVNHFTTPFNTTLDTDTFYFFQCINAGGAADTDWVSIAHVAVNTSSSGLVPKAPDDVDQVLLGDGSWGTVANDSHAHTNSSITLASTDLSDTADLIRDTDVDDTPVDAATTVPVSSNWAYDHENNVAVHTYPNFIEGFNLQYSSASAISVLAGYIKIDGALLSLGQTTVTSGTTWKDLGGTTVTRATGSLYSVYLYDNSGTLEVRVEKRTGTGDGADPVFDTAEGRRYWKAPSGVTSAEKFRCIGSFSTGLTDANILNFTQSGRGNTRTHIVHPAAAGNAYNRIVANVTSSGSVSIVNLHPVMAKGLFLKMHAKGDSTGVVRLYAADNAADATAATMVQISVYTISTGALALGPLYSPFTGTTVYYDGGYVAPNTVFYGFIDYMGYEATI